MGESLVERPTMEKRMDESVKSSGGLEVSVSFGRYENDLLSWEKWSSFSPNKYFEEVGSLSTPGSVAQKKAYFEAHYRKIAAMKADHLEQETSMNRANSSLDESRNDARIEDPCGVEAEFSLFNGEGLAEEAVIEEYESRLNEESTTNDSVEGVGGGESNAGVESTPVKVEIGREDSHKTKEKKHGTKQATPKMNTSRVAQKVTSTKRDSNPKRSTPIPKHSTKKVNGLSESKNLEPCPANPLPSQSTARKSLIMERMEGKDATRPAFKNFQNRANASSSSETKVESTASEAKISTPLPRKEVIKGSSRSKRSTAAAIPPAMNFRSDERAEKRREFARNSEAKSVARAAEKAQIRARTKEEKESEIKKLRKSLNFKAKPLPSFYKGSS